MVTEQSHSPIYLLCRRWIVKIIECKKWNSISLSLSISVTLPYYPVIDDSSFVYIGLPETWHESPFPHLPAVQEMNCQDYWVQKVKLHIIVIEHQCYITILSCNRWLKFCLYWVTRDLAWVPMILITLRPGVDLLSLKMALKRMSLCQKSSIDWHHLIFKPLLSLFSWDEMIQWPKLTLPYLERKYHFVTPQ